MKKNEDHISAIVVDDSDIESENDEPIIVVPKEIKKIRKPKKNIEEDTYVAIQETPKKKNN